MSWDSWGDFLAMGGYAPYVWGSVLMATAALAVEVAALKWRRRKMLHHLHQLHRPNAHFHDSGHEKR